jgi:aryl-alcohol dehydrogenase-like predicted oxidoreductase
VVTEIAAAHGVGADAVAVAAVLARSWAGTVLVGPSDTAQLDANLLAAQLTLDEAELAALDAVREPPADYWVRRSCLSWQ